MSEKGFHADDVLFLVELYVKTNGQHWKNNNKWEEAISGARSTSGAILKEQVLQRAWDQCHGLTFKSCSHDSSLVYPGEVQRLHRLEMLDNNLVGCLPTTMARCAELVFINVGHNKLGGRLPSDIGCLRSLRFLSVYGNRFEGTIPDSLGECLQLNTLYLNANRIEGALPENFSQVDIGGAVLAMTHARLVHAHL